MKLKREEFTIEDSPHKMYTEGSTDDAIIKEDVSNHLLNECGYKATNEIWWDDFMGFYRFSCDISKI